MGVPVDGERERERERERESNRPTALSSLPSLVLEQMAQMHGGERRGEEMGHSQ